MNDFNIEDLPSYIERLWNNLITSQVPTDFGNVTYYGLLRDALLMVKKLAETWTKKSADFDTQIKQALELIDSAQNLLYSINIDVQQIRADVDNALQEVNNELNTGLNNILNYVKTYIASDEFNNEVDEKLNELVTDERLQTIIESLKPFHFKDVNVTDTEDKTAFDTAVNNSGALSRTSTNNDLRTMLQSLIVSMNIPVLGKYGGNVLRNVLNVTTETEFGNNDYQTLVKGLTFKLNTANKIYQLYKNDNQYHDIVTDDVLKDYVKSVDLTETLKLYVLASYLEDVVDKETVYEPDLPSDCLTVGNLIDYLVLKTKGMIRVYTDNHGLQILATTDDIKNHCPYDVGDIYITTNNTNPNEKYPLTTWEAIEGETLVGYKENDDLFGKLGASVGEKTHTLTIDEMPSHNHNVSKAFSPTVQLQHGAWGVYMVGGNDSNFVQNTGGGQAHNNVQPSRVVRMWIRTA